MRLDFKSLAFGYSIISGAATPAWETALGQGKGYKINNKTTINELVKGLIYKAVPPKMVYYKKGKGGATVNGNEDRAGLVISAVFDKVFINETEIEGGKFILIIVKDDAESHRGRLKLKYGPDNSYQDGEVTIKNSDFIALVRNQFGLSDDACWFVTDMSVVDQDKLVLRTTIINRDSNENYADNNALHAAWDKYYEEIDEIEDGNGTTQTAETIDWGQINSLSNKDFIFTCLRIMKEQDLLNEENLNILQSKDLCRSKCGFPSYAILMEVNFSLSYMQQCYVSGNNRYYPNQFELGEKQYYVCNNWYPEYRSKFVEWLSSLISPGTVVEKHYVKQGENLILYGAPGCGKSRYIKDHFCNDRNYMERVVFHPDYTYSDFVGQILPENDNGHISYPFVPGPFTRILRGAVNDSKHNYYLIIEELNRGNAPAIFGEIFQLLDRIDGESEYGINNADIANEVYGDPGHQIKIPKNLFILATMNTSDQNVFTLDTAFKRRWCMRSIINDVNTCYFANELICDTNVSWKSFLTAINTKIVELGEGSIGSEDKRLGAFFVQPRELHDADLFSEKILMYLWNDAFKYNHDEVFKSEYKILEDLIKGFKDKRFDIFKIAFDTAVAEDEVVPSAEDATEITPDQYLEGKSSVSIEIYNKLIAVINTMGIDYSLGAVRNYISLKAPSRQIAAEIHLQRTNVKLLIKQPLQTQYQIGRLLPDTYRWSKNYEVIVEADTDMALVASAVVDSFNQVNG